MTDTPQPHPTGEAAPTQERVVLDFPDSPAMLAEKGLRALASRSADAVPTPGEDADALDELLSWMDTAERQLADADPSAASQWRRRARALRARLASRSSGDGDACPRCGGSGKTTAEPCPRCGSRAWDWRNVTPGVRFKTALPFCSKCCRITDEQLAARAATPSTPDPESR